jgi:hypothetical protein
MRAHVNVRGDPRRRLKCLPRLTPAHVFELVKGLTTVDVRQRLAARRGTPTGKAKVVSAGATEDPRLLLPPQPSAASLLV